MATVTLTLITSNDKQDTQHETFYPDSDEAINQGHDLANTLATVHKDAVMDEGAIPNHKWVRQNDTHLTTIYINRQMAYVIKIEA